MNIKKLLNIRRDLRLFIILFPFGSITVALLLVYFNYLTPSGVPGQFTNFVEGKGVYSFSNYSFSGNTITSTNIQIIKGGRYPSGLDKNGLNGTLVLLQNVQVIGTTPEVDGDTHIDLIDSTGDQLIVEFTPAYLYTPIIPQLKRTLGSTISQNAFPQIGSVINIVGVPYCDTFHATDYWHSPSPSNVTSPLKRIGSCWELHPAVAWSNNTVPFQINLRNNINYTFVQEPYITSGG